MKDVEPVNNSRVLPLLVLVISKENSTHRRNHPAGSDFLTQGRKQGEGRTSELTKSRRDAYNALSAHRHICANFCLELGLHACATCATYTKVRIRHMHRVRC